MAPNALVCVCTWIAVLLLITSGVSAVCTGIWSDDSTVDNIGFDAKAVDLTNPNNPTLTNHALILGGSGNPGGTLLWSPSGVCPACGGTTTVKASRPSGGLDGFEVTVLDSGLVLAVGGTDEDDGTSDKSHLYDPNTDTWFGEATLSTTREFLALAGPDDNGFVYAFGGNTDTADIYDPGTNSWTQSNDQLSESKGTSNRLMSAVILPDGDTILVIGGDKQPTTTELYSISNDQFSSLQSLVQDRQQDFGTCGPLDNGDAMVVGGKANADEVNAELYDTSWSVTSGFTTTSHRNPMVTTHVDGSCFIVGSHDNPSRSSAESYVGSTDTFCALPDTTVEHRTDGVLVAFGNGNVLLCGGKQGGNRCELFHDPNDPFPTNSPLPTGTVVPSASPIPSPSSSPAPSTTATAAPSSTPTAAPSTTETAAPSSTPTAAPSTTETAAPSSTATAAPSTTATAAASSTATAVPSTTATAAPSTTATAAPSTTATAAPSTTSTAAPSTTPTAPPSSTPTASPSDSPSPSFSSTETATASPSESSSPSQTPSISDTSSTTNTATASLSMGASVSPSPSFSSSPTKTPTISVTSSISFTPTISSSVTRTPTISETSSISFTPTISVSPVVSSTPSATLSPTISKTMSPTASPTKTATPSPSATKTRSLTPTRTITLSPTRSLLCGPAISCDDGDPCTDDFCDSDLGCLHSPSTGSICVTSDVCMVTSGICVSGNCVGEPVDCNDNNPCTLDSCDPAGGCTHVNTECLEQLPPPAPTAQPSPGASASVTPTATRSNELFLLSPYIDPLGPIPYNPYQVIQNTIPVVQDQAEVVEEAPVGPPEGESENEVLENTTLNWGAATFGLILVACAGCCAIALGLATVNKKDKSADDRLEEMLTFQDAHIDMNSTVENPAFADLNPV